MSEPPESTSLNALNRATHAAHCKRCLSGLPESQVEVDSSCLAVAFYCLGTFDLLGVLNDKRYDVDRESWREWIWEQQTKGGYGAGFKPGSYMTAQDSPEVQNEYLGTPHLIMTYTAFMSLAILRDDFTRLDRPGILKFLRACQREDGSFSTMPETSDSDLRTTYCAFAISSLLDDWSGVNVERALAFIASCRTYEGGYGQSPFCEAQGGTTYIAVASFLLAPSSSSTNSDKISKFMTEREQRQTIRWLLQNQNHSGGFCGRTGKEADACYCFWCGAALQMLGAKELVDSTSLGRFLYSCQFKYGGISKAPGESPDPYHTYLSLAALSMYSPESEYVPQHARSSWQFEPLDPLLNAREQTARWALDHISQRTL